MCGAKLPSPPAHGTFIDSRHQLPCCIRIRIRLPTSHQPPHSHLYILVLDISSGSDWITLWNGFIHTHLILHLTFASVHYTVDCILSSLSSRLPRLRLISQSLPISHLYPLLSSLHTPPPRVVATSLRRCDVPLVHCSTTLRSRVVATPQTRRDVPLSLALPLSLFTASFLLEV